jgi:hypothetical protein
MNTVAESFENKHPEANKNFVATLEKTYNEFSTLVYHIERFHEYPNEFTAATKEIIAELQIACDICDKYDTPFKSDQLKFIIDKIEYGLCKD